MIRKFALPVLALFASMPADAQLWTWTKEQMLEYTKAWTGDRFADVVPAPANWWNWWAEAE